MQLLHIFPSIREVLADFLFPKSPKVIELEKMSLDQMLLTLPKSEDTSNKSGVAIFDYSHPLVKEIVWEIKYNGNTKLAEIVSAILYDTICDELSERAFSLGSGAESPRPAIVPIPISDKRRFERGWNQSEILAERVVKNDSAKKFKYLPRQLAKVLHTESQTKTSSRSERLKNLTNSMKVLNPDSVAGRVVVVIDDVTTTGSTFAEALRALKTAGAKDVFCIALAH